MNTALWAAQILLAALYALVGLWKVKGQAALFEIMMPGLPLPVIRGVGLGEILAGSGLVLPAAAPNWTMVAGWAAVLLATDAAAFVVYHVGQVAIVRAVASFILGILAGFVAWGRL